MYTYQNLGQWFENSRKPGVYDGWWIDDVGNMEHLIPVHALRTEKPESYYAEGFFFKRNSANDWGF